ncbi:hypothetical protein [Kitasatospora sp. NPDC089509]|uniref:hypothetical protein n=1 Tax=Kitasatospora sp. NPDC089509 TaxID=3364079 RepID=UPI003813B74C
MTSIDTTANDGVSDDPTGSEASTPTAGYTWSGLDQDFAGQVAAVAATPQGGELAHSLVAEVTLGQPRTLGLPLLLHAHRRRELDELVASYHRMIETITAAWEHDAELRAVLTVPRALLPHVTTARDTRVHLLRLDLLPQPDGTLRVLETNANCPGGLPNAGQARAAWRPLLTGHGIALPPPLPADDPVWAGRWLTELAEQHTGTRPETVVLFQPRDSYRRDVPVYDAALTALGVRVLHADPRELRTDPHGGVTLHGEPVRHAYAKVGIQALLRMGDEAEPFLRAVREGTLFVQNGLRGRLIGDNKLCLAVLSDPRFTHLFDPADHRRVHPTIPWSRNIAHCDPATLRRITLDRTGHVLKRPLDTRGNGVVIGKETTDTTWETAVGQAVAEGWLVQEYLSSPHLPTTGATDGPAPRHDIALGAVNGRIASAFARTSHEERHNAALSAVPHPVYL